MTSPCPCPPRFLFGRDEPLCVRAERSSAGRLICGWHPPADSEGCPLPSAPGTVKLPRSLSCQRGDLSPCQVFPSARAPPLHLRGRGSTARPGASKGRDLLGKKVLDKVSSSLSGYLMSLYPFPSMHSSSLGINPHQTCAARTPARLGSAFSFSEVWPLRENPLSNLRTSQSPQ